MKKITRDLVIFSLTFLFSVIGIGEEILLKDQLAIVLLEKTYGDSHEHKQAYSEMLRILAELSEGEFKSSFVSPSTQIDRLVNWSLGSLVSGIDSSGGAKAEALKVLESGKALGENHPLIAKLREATDSQIESVFAKSTQGLRMQGFSTIVKSAKDFFGDKGFNIRPESFKNFFETELTFYLESLPESIKANILAEFVRLGPDASLEQKFEAISLRMLPQAQKLLQTIAGQPELDAGFARILRKILDGHPVSDLSNFAEILESPVVATLYPNKLFPTQESSAKAGTVAQTELDWILETEEGPIKVAIRLLKPEAQALVDAEQEIIAKMIPRVEANPIYKGTIFERFGDLSHRLSTNLVNELNLVRTADLQMAAHKAYAPRPNLSFFSNGVATDFRVPRVYHPELAKEGLLIMEMIPGVSADDFFAKYPHLRAQVMKDITVLWSRESLFLSGLFHADIHLGNMLFDFDPKSQRVIVGFVDWGMGEILDSKIRSGLITIQVRLKAFNTNANVKAIRETLIEDVGLKLTSSFSLTDLTRIVAKHLDLRSDADDLITDVMTQGGQFSHTLVNFHRGGTHLLNQHLEKAGVDKTYQKIRDQVGDGILFPEVAGQFLGIPKATGFSNMELAKITKARMENACASTLRNLSGGWIQ